MHSSFIAVVLMTVAVSMTTARPGLLFSLPAASSDTHVVRDALGNQATSYAYQDGHSSAVAVSRSDVSKHLVYHQPAPIAYGYPQVAPVYHHQPAVAAYPVYQHQYQYQTSHTPLVYQNAYYV